MVSLNSPISSPNRWNMIQDYEDSSKKRKWEGIEDDGDNPLMSKAKNAKCFFETELYLDSPLPLEWQRCLDIKSGQVYYYNTRTNKKTSKDPRIHEPESEPLGSKHMSLDLELNLPCGSSVLNNQVADNFTKCNNSASSKNPIRDGLRRSLSWLALEGDHQQDMVTAVCKKCHMLVMMFKSSPSCPNCKFMHPIEQKPLGRELSLLC